ncbi:DUF599 domain-containing protein [Marinovum sp. 2_MG-2023]|uniref:DUF599 domain-containing protein n=1 Tax=Roseobacteraceae TaxID=2854170 RepID=UPI001FD0B881|nr:MULTISPECIES: DUF599 domain-containing protein [Roseobacteraceae]MCJ7874999.1 DUF599 domain-containing protein [Phaeobacter sp. J2-8]MDO6730591.1 DUF599 domain-containing protein [Marinovum sp. 2_MG-2023]MDO6778741.1 DUF599 domain-containing protein [Marinovum sp. 1_MG-2023]
MTWTDRLTLFEPLDYIAVAVLIVSWIAIGLRIENPGKHPSVSTLTTEYRREWMKQMLTRDPRIFDSQILSILRQGTAFFASTCMIAIGGVLALIGNAERLAGLAQDLTLESDPIVVWELKLIAVILLAINGFLSFVWSHRLFGYCAVVMAAVPNDPNHPAAPTRAHKAAELNISGARAYNRGLRSIYFAMAATAWLLGAIPLILAVLFTLAVLYRREFASNSREALLLPETGPEPKPAKHPEI